MICSSALSLLNFEEFQTCFYLFFLCLNSCQSLARMAPSSELLGDPVQPDLTAGRSFVGSNVGCVLLWSSRHPYTDRESRQKEKQSIAQPDTQRTVMQLWGYFSRRVPICVWHIQAHDVKSLRFICSPWSMRPVTASLIASNHRHDAEDVQNLRNWRVCGKAGWYIRGGGKLTGAYCSKRRWRMSPWLILMMQSFSLKSRSCSAFPPGSRRFTSRPWVLEMIKW